MKFTHADGEQAPSRKSLNDGRQVAVVDGVFEVDPCPDDLRDRLIAKGHAPMKDGDPPDEPVEESPSDATGSDDDDDDGDAEPEVPTAGEFSEQQLVEMGYREKQAIAKQYGHIDATATDDELTEELIKQRREEADD